MKIAVLFPNSPLAGWSASRGIGPTLRRMGHEVLEVPVRTDPRATQLVIEGEKMMMPPIGVLKRYDLILTAGTEHIAAWLDTIYGKYEWKDLPGAKACWFHESFNRDDYSLDFDFLRPWGEEFFFPGIQDAEMHDQESFALGHAHWLPFGVDTELFRPKDFSSEEIVHASVGALDLGLSLKNKNFGVAFMGLLYGKRKAMLDALARHAIPPIRIGNVEIKDLHGYQFEESTKRYASNLREISVFLNLPALSRLLVNKVYEVLACGTFLLTPILPDEQGVAANMKHFTDKVHLRYYKPTNLPYLTQMLNEYLSEEHAEERERMARIGCREVHAKHSLEGRLTELLVKVGVKQVVS